MKGVNFHVLYGIPVSDNRCQAEAAPQHRICGIIFPTKNAVQNVELHQFLLQNFAVYCRIAIEIAKRQGVKGGNLSRPYAGDLGSPTQQ